jgi:hypothetical protein
LAARTYINLVSRVLAHTFEFSVSRSRSPSHNLLPRVPLGRFASLKHRQPTTRSVGSTDRLAGLLVSRTHLSETAVSLVDGDQGTHVSQLINYLTKIYLSKLCVKVMSTNCEKELKD